MALRDILILPDKRLRQVSEPVKKIDAGIRSLIEDMFETMYDAPGIGLAAIQVGTAKRVVTMDLAKKEDPKNPQVFINPEVLWMSEEKKVYEEFTDKVLHLALEFLHEHQPGDKKLVKA